MCPDRIARPLGSGRVIFVIVFGFFPSSIRERSPCLICRRSSAVYYNIIVVRSPNILCYIIYAKLQRVGTGNGQFAHAPFSLLTTTRILDLTTTMHLNLYRVDKKVTAVE